MANKTVTVLLKAITGAYRAEMTKAARATAAVGAAAGRTGRAHQFLLRHLGPTGVAAAKVAVGFAGVGGVAAAFVGSAKAAVDFEDQFARVRKTVDGGKFELDRLALGFRELGTEIPTTIDELTRVGEAAGQLGIERENILSFTRTMVDLGNTTNLSAEEAAVALARLANITQMPQSQFRTLGSVLVELGNNFATTEAEIAEMATRLAGAGSEIGLTEAEILSFATTLSSVGVKAEAGGSAFSRVFTRIRDSVDNGGQQLEVFAQIAGKTAEDFARLFERRPAEAIQLFIEGFGRLDEAGVNTTAVLQALQLAELRVADSLRRTAGAGDLLARTLRTSNAELEDTSALNDEVEKKYATTASRIRVMIQSFKDVGITFGNALLPFIGKGADMFAAFADDIKEFLTLQQGLWDETTTGVRRVVKALGEQEFTVDKVRGAFIRAWRSITDGSRDARGGIDSVGTGAARTADAMRFAGRAAQDYHDNVVMANRELVDQNRFTAGLEASTRMLAEGLGVTEEEFLRNASQIEKNVAAMDAMQEHQDDLQGAINAFFDPLENYNTLLDAKTEKEREAAEAQADATKTAKDSWEDFMGVIEVSGRDVIKGMEDQIQAFRDWRNNLKTIAERGRTDIASELAAMGPEGAGLVKAWAEMSDDEFRKAGRLWDKQNKQNVDKVISTIDGGMREATRKARSGASDMTAAINKETEVGLRVWERKLDGMPDHMRKTGDRTEREGDRGAKDTADAINRRTDRGVRDHRRRMETIPPTIRSIMRSAEDRADRGSRDTMNVIERRTDRGVRNHRRIIGGIPPSIRATMRSAEDRGRSGAEKTATAMNRKIASGVRKWARIVDGYATGLRGGLNPVLKQLKAGQIKSTRDASVRAIERAVSGFAEGGFRPQAHITNTPVVLFGEPEAGGEAFIPFAPAKRPRSRKIASEAVRRLGGVVDWFADGGMRGHDGSIEGAVLATPGTDMRAANLERSIEVLAARFQRFAIGGIIEAGRAIQRMGYHVAEHPAFGGVAPVHVPNSYHYRGQAIDVNWLGRNEPSRLDFLKSWILRNVQRNLIRELIWRAPGHWGHLHLAMAAGGGGAFIPGGMGDLFATLMPDLPKTPKSDGTVLGDTAVAAMQHTRDKVDAWLQKNLFAFAGAGVGASGSLGNWIRQAMAITGVPASWFGPLVGLARHESGGNPRAVNNWDINARRGDPSKGLMQTISATFNAHALGGMRDIWNPVHNAVAAIRYILSRYGSIFRIPSYRGGNRFVGGYEQGTDFVPQTGLAMVHRGERITPASQNRALASFASDAQSLGMGGLRPGERLTLVVEGQPLTAVVERRLSSDARRRDVIARKGVA